MAQVLTLLISGFLPPALIKMGPCSGADVFGLRVKRSRVAFLLLSHTNI